MRSRLREIRKLVHWVIVALCASQIPTSEAIKRTHLGVPFGIAPSARDLFLHDVHTWTGLVVLLLASLLVVIRWRGLAPAMPADMPRWQMRLAVLVRLLIYGVILGMVITGMGAKYVSHAFAPIHRSLFYLGLGLVAVHAAAALWHQFVKRDGLLLEMLPFVRGRDDASGFTQRPPRDLPR